MRKEIVTVLAQDTLSARDLSVLVRVSEKEVYEHLDHIRRSMERGADRLVIVPPECRKCGFLFTHLDRLRKPGKCPVCRSESIHEPHFRIQEREG